VAGRLLGKNVVFWGHGWIKKYDTLRGMVRKLFFHLPNSILLYGHYAKELAIEDGIPAERLHVVYNSLDYEAQLVMRAKPGAGINIEERRKYFANPDLPILICSSRLTLQRELPLAFEAMALLKRDGLETNLLLLGDGPERQRLEALARELNLNVHFVGACYDEARIATLTQLANLTIAPGQVGLTAMHSLTYGVPVITHSDPANQMPESEAVIDGWNGVLFQRGDVNDLARAIRDGLCHFREIDKTRERCYEVIDRFYNPNHQAKIIERAVRRQPALDDGWEEFVSSRSVRAR
jgi:glycosyltransferase involved in cell wall biosynthesis